METTYSSVHLRERDKILEAKHQKEIAEIERKVEKLRWAYNDAMKKTYDAEYRGNRLAMSLGFQDIHEAQTSLENADYDITYRDCFDRVRKLEGDLRAAREENGNLNEQLASAEEEQAKLRAQLKETTQSNQKGLDNLGQEYKELKSRYDALLDVKTRAAERYTADYKKWRAFKNWLFDEDRTNTLGDSKELEKGRKANLFKKKQRIMELGPNWEADANQNIPLQKSTLYPPAMGRTEMESDKENQITPVVEPRERRDLPVQLISVKLENVPNTENLLTAASASSPTSLLDTASPTAMRTPLSLRPNPNTEIRVKSEFSLTTGRLPPKPINTRSKNRQGSSDTEPDSQASEMHPPPTIFKVPAPPNRTNQTTSSDTEEDTQSLPFPSLPQLKLTTPTNPAQPTPTTLAHPTLPARPSFPPKKPRRQSDSFVAGSCNWGYDQSVSELNNARKVRRVSGDDFSSSRAVGSSPTVVGGALTTPQELRPEPDLLRNTPNQGGKGKGKGKEKETRYTPKNARPNGQRRIEDYSAYKGRGRYARDVAGSAEKTINAQFAIDPARNGGVAYQYDEVVRTRDERRQMDAGDCECCRDYYEAIGPLPNRLQQPLWRSPSATPAKPCQRHSHPPDAEWQPTPQEIESHKKAISRHRHTWARASTPPDYWNIGFPDTQEAGAINERADEMHRRKRAEVEKMAMLDTGRYRRR